MQRHQQCHCAFVGFPGASRLKTSRIGLGDCSGLRFEIDFCADSHRVEVGVSQPDADCIPTHSRTKQVGRRSVTHAADMGTTGLVAAPVSKESVGLDRRHRTALWGFHEIGRVWTGQNDAARQVVSRSEPGPGRDEGAQSERIGRSRKLKSSVCWPASFSKERVEDSSVWLTGTLDTACVARPLVSAITAAVASGVFCQISFVSNLTSWSWPTHPLHFLSPREVV